MCVSPFLTHFRRCASCCPSKARVAAHGDPRDAALKRRARAVRRLPGTRRREFCQVRRALCGLRPIQTGARRQGREFCSPVPPFAQPHHFIIVIATTPCPVITIDRLTHPLWLHKGKVSAPRSLLAGLGAGLMEAIFAVTPSETIKYAKPLSFFFGHKL